MTIKREDLDSGRVDLSEVIAGGRLPAVHPGDILRDDFLQPFGMSVLGLAKELKVSRSRISDVVRRRRTVSTNTALRLARYFGTTPEFWINLQARYELDMAKHSLWQRVEREVAPRAA